MNFVTGIVVFVFDSTKFLGLITPLIHFLVALPIAMLIKYQAFYGAANGYGYFKMYRQLELFFIIAGNKLI